MAKKDKRRHTGARNRELDFELNKKGSRTAKVREIAREKVASFKKSGYLIVKQFKK